jgi:cytochrome c peroxidase
MFFNDASLCFQHWQSCASCHPDGRADGLNWDLLNDGLGNPKNTKSLLLSHKTPPVMSLGARDKAETAVRTGIKLIQFAVRPQEDAAAIDAYCRSLEPVPSPYRARASSAVVKRGQRVFQQAGCASCHPAPLYTDMKSYDVGTGKEVDAGLKFDTPTLVEVWRTAPYLHDGRAATMKEVLTRHNPGDKHGATTGLNEVQLEDLAAFVLAQ